MKEDGPTELICGYEPVAVERGYEPEWPEWVTHMSVTLVDWNGAIEPGVEEVRDHPLTRKSHQQQTTDPKTGWVMFLLRLTVVVLKAHSYVLPLELFH